MAKDGGNPLEKPWKKAGEKLKGGRVGRGRQESSRTLGGPRRYRQEARQEPDPWPLAAATAPGSGGSGGQPGVGKGRRMPVQQSVDVGAPIQKTSTTSSRSSRSGPTSCTGSRA